ncbi:MAG: hypothetical protein VB012_01445 [Erysipelotrichaceae bacterium]|nr:hypothetical protein [Erysipelotrichaceae bacterium]
MKKNKILTILTLILLVLVTFSLGVLLTLKVFLKDQVSTAETVSIYTDIAVGSLDERAVDKAIDLGFLDAAYTNNGLAFRPDQALSKAEMLAGLTKVFGADALADISTVTDVSSNTQYYTAASLAVQMNIIKLSEQLNLNQSVTAEEFCQAIAVTFGLSYKDIASADGYTINNESDRPYIAAMAERGYISSTGFNADATVTRLDYAYFIANTIALDIDSSGEYDYNKINGTVLIKASDVILNVQEITGDIVICDSVKDGNVTLAIDKVYGNIVLRGGGENTVTVRDYSGTSNTSIDDFTTVNSTLISGNEAADHNSIINSFMTALDGAAASTLRFVVIKTTSTNPIRLLNDSERAFDEVILLAGSLYLTSSATGSTEIGIVNQALGTYLDLASGHTVGVFVVNSAIISLPNVHSETSTINNNGTITSLSAGNGVSVIYGGEGVLSFSEAFGTGNIVSADGTVMTESAETIADRENAAKILAAKIAAAKKAAAEKAAASSGSTSSGESSGGSSSGGSSETPPAEDDTCDSTDNTLCEWSD